MNLFDFFRNYDIVTVMTFFPCIGALFLFLLPAGSPRIRLVAFFFSLWPLLFALRMLGDFDPACAAAQFRSRLPWIPSLSVDYFVGVDGLSMAMVLLVSILTPLTVLGAFNWTGTSEANRYGAKPFYALILLEQTGLYGAFTALNFFHWFIFWEASLVPMFFLIKLYGGPDRTHAAYQFFVYTFVGSVAMLIGMQFVYLATNSWDFVELARMARTTGSGESELAMKIRTMAGTLGIPWLMEHSVTFIFALVFLGFAVKVPLWPFHTWLPVTYTQAPTAGAMLLTGLMSKMGVYGFLRIVLPLFGATMGQYATLLMLLAAATILFGALAALAQRDLKTLVAYSSVNHLGYCLLGVFAVASATGNLDDKALALNGVIVQMFAHGLSAAGLFYFIGLIEQRAQTRQLDDLGGLRKTVPVLCGLMGITMFASLGLPGLAGFVGEFMIFRGAFPLAAEITALAVVGILLTALYLLTMTGRVFFGPQDDKWNGMSDLTLRERVVSGVLVALLFGIGLAPAPLIDLSNSAVMLLAKSLV
ncbi:MAG: NADH-quinone oxidoreductase subunit M [Verrucomicrobia bacterium]|nr:NADH-quinone oxidoreductase subunit M [Verrucomicrobiota bacterium]